MHLSQISLALTRLSGQFSPASLFAAGEVGAWYDPSDFSTLFTDSAGTTPVTGVEQFVGLMLDKSKGLVLGPELVTNGNFSSGTTGWTATNGSIAAVSGELRVTNTGTGFGTGYQSLTTVAGKTYKVTLNAYAGTAATVYAAAKNASLANPDLAVTSTSSKTSLPLSFVFTAVSTTTVILVVNSNENNATGFFDNISVRELPGNHATQSSTTKRPKLAARYNLLTYTEQFDNGVWVKNSSSVSANSTVAPNGTTTADTFTSSAAATSHNLQYNGLSAYSQANLNFTAIVSLKAGTHNFVTLSFSSGSADAWAAVTVDLSTGAATKTGNGVNGTLVGTPTVVSQGNGWYQVILTARYASGVGTYVFISSNSSGTPTYGSYGLETWTPAGTETILVWGADLRPASQATGLIGPTYQRVVDAATYDTAGFLPYLQFDGLSWSMSTNSIDFSATDKMTAWAGVRKLSTSAGWICETSVSIDTNNGAFLLNVDNSGFEYIVASKGTTYRPAQLDNSAYLSPITNVLTEIADISGDSVVMRLNGTQVATNTNDQGTGNYGNYPLFIGARNNASLYFNGWLTSLIVRGAQSTQSQIETTESWVNGKTGAY
jgi:hypothetical protein